MVFSLFKKLFSSDSEKNESVEAEMSTVAEVAVEPETAEQQETGKSGGKHERHGHERGGRNRHGKRSQRQASNSEAPIQQLTQEEEEKVMNRLQELVRFIATSLVDAPEQFGMELTEKEGTRVIMLSCEKKDAGKLIGRNGRIIAAIRILVSGTAARSGLKVTVDIVD